MPKYLIDIPDGTVYGYDEDEKILIFPEENFIEVSEVSNLIYLPNVVPYEESDRKAIEDEVWEFATTCTKMDGSDSVDVFGGFSVDSFTKYSYQEAKAKYEAWKKKDKIRVGDEVVYADDPNKEKAIVLRLYQPKQYRTLADILCEDGTVVKMIKVENLAWTGRHFDEIADLLKKMKEE